MLRKRGSESIKHIIIIKLLCASQVRGQLTSFLGLSSTPLSFPFICSFLLLARATPLSIPLRSTFSMYISTSELWSTRLRWPSTCKVQKKPTQLTLELQRWHVKPNTVGGYVKLKMRSQLRWNAKSTLCFSQADSHHNIWWSWIKTE